MAVAWKSAICRLVAVLKKPLRMSTIKPWKMASGLPPPTIFCFLSLSVTALTVALSGMTLVLKDKIPRYCLRAASSPRLKMLEVLLMLPPTLLFSVFSSTQPSCAPREVNVMVMVLGVLVTVFVAVIVPVGDGVKVAVAVGVSVPVGEGVSVDVKVAVAVADAVKVTVFVIVPVGDGVGVNVSVAVGVLLGVSV